MCPEHKTHGYLTLLFTPLFRAWRNSRGEVCACSVVSYVSQWPVNPLQLHNNNSHLACLKWKPTFCANAGTSVSHLAKLPPFSTAQDCGLTSVYNLEYPYCILNDK